MEIVFIIIGLAAGLAIGYLLGKSKLNALEAKSNALADENLRLRDESAALGSKVESLADERNQRANEVGVLNNTIQNLNDKLAESNRGFEQKLQEERFRHEQEKAEAAESLKLQLQEKDLVQDKEIAALKQHYDELILSQDKRHKESVDNMEKTFNDTILHLKLELKSLTEDMLKMRQQEFSETSKNTMKDIVDPLNQTIQNMKAEMTKYSESQQEFSGAMKANLQTIISKTEDTCRSAEELTTALKHDTKVQGDYGEAILDEILAKQGFTKGIHYDVQYVERDDAGHELKGDDGKGLRPDVVVHLDTRRDVIIDSKMNLTEFIEFANAKTPEERREHLEKHVKSIESQVRLLSQKDYSKYHKNTNARMDYVIMFVPISAAWWEALRFKPSLWREAMNSNVYIADEQTLFAALRIIRLTWTQIEQVDNHKKIYDLANEMLNRVGMFMESYKSIGDHLDKARSAFEEGRYKLTPGGKSIVTTAAQLIKIGAKDSNQHPVAPYIDIDEVEQLPTSGWDGAVTTQPPLFPDAE